jgi:hypothetical protein
VSMNNTYHVLIDLSNDPLKGNPQPNVNWYSRVVSYTPRASKDEIEGRL